MSRGKGGKVLGLSAFPPPPAGCSQGSSVHPSDGARGVGVRHEGKTGVILNWEVREEAGWEPGDLVLVAAVKSSGRHLAQASAPL